MMNRSSSTPHALHARHLLAKHWVCLVVVFDDVIQCLKTFWGSCIMHVASERLWPWSLKTEAASLPVIVSTAAWVPCAMLGLGIIFCPSPPHSGPDGTPRVPSACLDDSVRHGPRPEPVRKPPLPRGFLWQPSASRP
jgi:hypothetical protein